MIPRVGWLGWGGLVFVKIKDLLKQINNEPKNLHNLVMGSYIKTRLKDKAE